MPMRSALLDDYFNQVMRAIGEQTKVYQEIYRNVMDNRIFNNLKQQLNEMIADEKSLIEVEEFKKIFFTYFKGEFKANLLYEQLLPFIIVWNIGNNVWNDPSEVPSPEQLIEAERMVSIQKLTRFIDAFNFYPVRVSQLHYKNTSNDMTYVMTSNTKQSLTEKDPSPPWQDKNEEEKRLIKLLSLVSMKINERFRNLREAFRYIDTDHS